MQLVRYYMPMKPTNHQSGFTLVEMIVSLAIFAIVVTVSVGALLVLVGTNQRLQSEQSVMTNLSFALDSMTREIRTGSYYYCFSSLNANQITSAGYSLDTALTDQSTGRQIIADCANGNNSSLPYHGIAFTEGGDSISGATNSRIVYFYDAGARTVKRRVGTEEAQPIISSEVYIVDFRFFVTGSEDLKTDAALSDAVADVKQPTVTIYVRAAENPDGSGKQFEVQTTVTQRILDV